MLRLATAKFIALSERKTLLKFVGMLLLLFLAVGFVGMGLPQKEADVSVSEDFVSLTVDSGARVEVEEIKAQQCPDKGVLLDDCVMDALLAKAEDNVIWSPLSVKCALNVAMIGARNSTLAQYLRLFEKQSMDKLFGNYLEIGKRYIEDYDGDANEEFERMRKPSMKLANRVWLLVAESSLTDWFRQRTKHMISTELMALNTANDKAEVVNQWVAETTNDEIKRLVSAQNFGDAVAMVITNAVYFKAPFAFPFKEHKTRKAAFYRDSQRITVALANAKMMQQMSERMRVVDLESESALRAVSLPFKGTQISLIVSHSRLTLALLKSLSFEPRSVFLFLPSFDFEFETSLKEALAGSCALCDAFSAEADFGAMMKKPNGLHIADVIHKAKVKVTEKGTIAAAATAVVMEMASIHIPTKKPEVISFDFPFHFYIYDAKEAAVLFQGFVAIPSEFEDIY